MATDLNTYRARIGHYDQSKQGKQRNQLKKRAKTNSYSRFSTVPLPIVVFYLLLSLISTNLLAGDSSMLKLKLSLNKLSILGLILFISANLLLSCGDIHPNPGPDKLFINSINAQSLKGTTKSKVKLIDFENLLEVQQPDVMAVCETWLNKMVKNTEVYNHNIYRGYRLDREDIRGGGVLLLVRKSLWSTERKDLLSPTTKHNEMVAAEIRPNKGRRILVISVYRSQTDPSKDFLANLEHILHAGCLDNIKEFLILGDFNYRELTWIEN